MASSKDYFAGNTNIADWNTVKTSLFEALQNGGVDGLSMALDQLYVKIKVLFDDSLIQGNAREKAAKDSVQAAVEDQGKIVSGYYEGMIAKYIKKEAAETKTPHDRVRRLLTTDSGFFQDALKQNNRVVTGPPALSFERITERTENAYAVVGKTSRAITKLENKLLLQSANYLAWDLIQKNAERTNAALKNEKRKLDELRDREAELARDKAESRQRISFLRSRMTSGSERVIRNALCGPAPMKKVRSTVQIEEIEDNIADDDDDYDGDELIKGAERLAITEAADEAGSETDDADAGDEEMKDFINDDKYE